MAKPMNQLTLMRYPLCKYILLAVKYVHVARAAEWSLGLFNQVSRPDFSFRSECTYIRSLSKDNSDYVRMCEPEAQDSRDTALIRDPRESEGTANSDCYPSQFSIVPTLLIKCSGGAAPLLGVL